MLCETAERLAVDVPDITLRRALVESFAVHARNLHHFLWGPGADSDNVLAKDYFRGTGWSTPEPEPLHGLRKEVSRYIAHISYRRPPHGMEKRWPLTIANEIYQCMQRWRGEVAVCLLSPAWSEQLTITLANIDASPSTGTTAMVNWQRAPSTTEASLLFVEEGWLGGTITKREER